MVQYIFEIVMIGEKATELEHGKICVLKLTILFVFVLFCFVIVLLIFNNLSAESFA